MLKDLELLIQLQEIDLRIKEQQIAQEQFPETVSELKNSIADAENDFSSIQEKLQKTASTKEQIAEKVSDIKEHLGKSQERLSSIKTNREYDAVHLEIESQKNMLVNSEHKLQSQDNEIELLTSAVENAQQELERVKGENEPQINELQSKIDAIDSVIEEINKEREKIAPQVSPQTLRVYDNIRKKRKTGRALSIVNESKTCTVCYKILEPQLFNETRRGNRILLCESCGSILVWQNPEQQE